MYWATYTELGLLLCTGTLLGEQHCLDVRQDTTLSNSDPSQQLVQFFIIPELIMIRLKDGSKVVNSPDGKLKMPGDDARLLVVPGSIAGQLQDLGSQVLHDCSHVHWSTGSNSLGIVAFPNKVDIIGGDFQDNQPEKPVDPAHRELKACSAGAGLGLSLDLAALSTSRHVYQSSSAKI